MSRPGSRTLVGLLAVLFAALGGALLVCVLAFREMVLIDQRDSALHDARMTLQHMLRTQLDQETGLRGYIASGKIVFLQPYYQARGQYSADLTLLRHELADLGLDHLLDRDMERLEVYHIAWMEDVAVPLQHDRHSLALLTSGKVLMDELRVEFTRVDSRFAAELSASKEREQRLLLRGVTFALIAIALFAGVCSALYALLNRAQRELGREREITSVLQQAFTGSSPAPPGISFGSEYLSSTEGAAVGGDVLDLYRLSDTKCLILVADVSGKGIYAAVDTASIKYSARALAFVAGDVAALAGVLNTIYRRDKAPQGNFVVLFVAILDTAASTLTYVNAGLGSVFLLRNKNVTPLEPTAPAIGITEHGPFDAQTLLLRRGDSIIASTDGFTEARDPARVLLGEDEMALWLSEIDDTGDAQQLVDALISRLLSYSAGHLSDDLALIAFTVGTLESQTGLPLPARV